jgi:hypothetical protein
MTKYGVIKIPRKCPNHIKNLHQSNFILHNCRQYDHTQLRLYLSICFSNTNISTLVDMGPPCVHTNGKLVPHTQVHHFLNCTDNNGFFYGVSGCTTFRPNLDWIRYCHRHLHIFVQDYKHSHFHFHIMLEIISIKSLWK